MKKIGAVLEEMLYVAIAAGVWLAVYGSIFAVLFL